jgi:tetratricopeptide (TPR) repeat protein
MLDKALKKEVIVLGKDDPRTLATMSNVATQLSKLDRCVEALNMYEKVFEKRSRIQGAEHPDTVKTLCELAITQNNAGRYDDARQSTLRCLSLARKFGDEKTAARCVYLLSLFDDARKHNDESTSAEQKRLLDKLNDRKKQAQEKAEAARLKAATAQPSTKEPSIDELMAQWGFDDDDGGGGKKKSSNATSDGGGSTQKKKGKGKK